MNTVSNQEIESYVKQHIGDFHTNRFEALQKIKLETILKRKNPYLFRAKHLVTAHDLVKSIVDAYLSSQEETIFGEFLEGLAIFICSKVFSGVKSSAEGIDLEFERDDIRYLVSIKSGPNWGNSSQIQKLKDNFNKARKILGSNLNATNIVAVNGCCYGKDDKPDKGVYLKLCGQRFWEFISGNEPLYLEIIEPLGHQAKQRNEAFLEEYSKLLNQLTASFMERFCEEGVIIWEKVVSYNSKS